MYNGYKKGITNESLIKRIKLIWVNVGQCTLRRVVKDFLIHHLF